VNWLVQKEVVMTLHFTPQFIHPVHSRQWMWSRFSPTQILWQIKHPVTLDLILQKYNRNRKWTVMMGWISSYHVSRFNTGNNKRSVVMVLSQFYPTPIVTTYFLQIILMLSHQLLNSLPRSYTNKILRSFHLPIPSCVSGTSEHRSLRYVTTQITRSLPLLYLPLFSSVHCVQHVIYILVFKCETNV
jgi:hypothetical protein